MRLLFVSEYYPPHVGGVEVVFKNLAELLAKAGHECHVITSGLPNTRRYEEINGVRIHRVNVPKKGTRYWFTFLSIPAVIARARQVDLIQTTTFNAAFPAWLASKLLRKKCVITVHEVWGKMWSNLLGMNWLWATLHRFLEKAIVCLPFDRVICVSEYTRRSLEALTGKNQRAEVIYNGIDTDLFTPRQGDDTARKRFKLAKGTFVYLYYGRPGLSKGVEYLVSAVPLISQRIPDSKLVLILTNEPRDRYESIKKLIKDLNIEGKVMLLDPLPRSELPDYIAASDCVVIPSLSEGFGFSAAEACAMEKPVVASNVASLPEVVSGKYVLVEPGNPKAIAEGIEKVYKGETENSQKKIFSWEECASRYLKVYQELAN
ncbi:MAG TPA: glycosyltransferase family 4 protein [Dehalococcoidia bacterium]|nr:glycosyltransferase family 4 protein [Dehalococcoidia bacterium]